MWKPLTVTKYCRTRRISESSGFLSDNEKTSSMAAVGGENSRNSCGAGGFLEAEAMTERYSMSL